MFTKFFVDVCVGIMLCTNPTPVTHIAPPTPVYNECKNSMYTTEDDFTEVKPSSDSLQELLVVKRCDNFNWD